MGKEVDPSDVGKHPELIRKAQYEMTRSDILVCGQCHGVFHFIEEFVDHKNEGCSDGSKLRDIRETKPKVWAFLLWKASQSNGDKSADNTNVNSWNLYQTYSKLDEAIRETWIVAGRTIQSFARMGQGNLQEMPVKITKTVVDTSNDTSSDAKRNPTKTVIRPQLPSNQNRTPLNKINVDKIKDENNTSFDSSKNEKSGDVKVIKKTITRSPLTKLPANPSSIQLNKNVSRIAQKTIPNTDETEQQTIEKILAKRFNPRRREHEYLIKWEHFTHEQNTWEPQTNLASCPQLLETFEKQLARQKEQRAAMAAKSAAEAEAAKQNQAKAMDQVKQWCANNEEEAQKKRKADDTEMEHDDEDTAQPSSKAIRRDNMPAVAQAIQRVGQSGIRIVPVSKPAVAVVGTTPKANGLSGGVTKSSPIVDKHEVGGTPTLIGKQTGIVKKPGAVASLPAPKSSEAQIRVVQKGEGASSGVVRINMVTNAQPQMKVVQRQVGSMGGTPKSMPTTGNTIIRQSQAPKGPIGNTKASIAARAPPANVTTIRGQSGVPHGVLAKPGIQRSQQILQQNQRTSLSPNSAASGVKPVISRVVKAPAGKQPQAASQEDKLAALQRHGDLKITRKQLPTKPKVQQHQQHVDESEYAAQQEQQYASNTAIAAATEIEDKVNTLKMEQQQEHLQQQQLQQEGAGIMSVEGAGEIHQVMVNEDGSPILVTGEDGTVYQVAGKNEQGQTILIAQGADGEQQCVYVTSEESEDPASLLGLPTTTTTISAEQHQQQQAEQQQAQEQQQQQIISSETHGEETPAESDVTQPLAIATDSDSQDGQITAEVVQADLPSPGGTRRVVLLLPDGSFMMTEVSDEQYQALNLVS